MPVAYSYLRFSTPEQAKGDSTRRQSALAEAYARTHGLTLDTKLTLADLGVSAFRGKNLEIGALADFKRAVEDGIVPVGSYLLVESLDRISRQVARKAARALEDIVELGVTVVTLNDGRTYTQEGLDQDPYTFLMAVLTFMRAHEESDMKSRRLSAVWGAKRDAATSKPLTSICPAWLRLDKASGRFSVLEDRAAIVRRIYTDTLAGVGQHRIASALNAEGVAVFGKGKRQGAHWHRSYVVKLLSNPAVVGTLVPHRMVHQDGKRRRQPLEPVPDYYPAIVDPDDFARVQAMRDGTRQPQRGRHAAAPVANILGGLAVCGTCGASVVHVSKGPRWRYLVCSRAKVGAGCEYRAVRYGTVEAAIVQNIDRIVAEAPIGGGGEKVEAELQAEEAYADRLRDELRNLLDTAAAGRVSSAALTERIGATEAALTRAEARLRELAESLRDYSPLGRAARLEAILEAAKADPLDRGTLNAALRAALRRVVVEPQWHRLALEWRHGGMSEFVYDVVAIFGDAE